MTSKEYGEDFEVQTKLEMLLDNKDRTGKIMLGLAVVEISPVEAEFLLGTSEVNRNMRHHVVNKYARDMDGGRWILSGESIKIDWDGKLIDGEHRLRAIISSGKTIKMVVNVGLEPEAQSVMDSGAKRTIGDRFAFAGFSDRKYGARIAAAARVCWQVDKYKSVSRSTQPTDAELIDYTENHQSIISAVYAVDGLSAVVPVSPAYSAVVYYYGCLGMPEETVKFFERLRSGVGLHHTDPELLLIHRLAGNKDGLYAKFFLLARALNLVRTSTSLTRLTIPTTSEPISEKIISQLLDLQKGMASSPSDEDVDA